jgi:DNA invertase Pin-like site-specific DNA recombinase
MTNAVKRANTGGRPRSAVNGADVVRLRDQGGSWRKIAREFKIGTATAMRLYRLATVPKPSQNLQDAC